MANSYLYTVLSSLASYVYDIGNKINGKVNVPTGVIYTSPISASIDDNLLSISVDEADTSNLGVVKLSNSVLSSDYSTAITPGAVYNYVQNFSNDEYSINIETGLSRTVIEFTRSNSDSVNWNGEVVTFTHNLNTTELPIIYIQKTDEDDEINIYYSFVPHIVDENNIQFNIPTTIDLSSGTWDLVIVKGKNAGVSGGSLPALAGNGGKALVVKSNETGYEYATVATENWVEAKKYITSSYVSTAISNLVGSAPDTLNTLEELADALNDNPNIITGLIDNINTKQDKITSENKLSAAFIETDSTHQFISAAKLAELETKTATLPIGTIFPYVSNNPPAGAYTLNGQTIDCSGDLSSFLEWVTDGADAGNIRTLTFEQYSAENEACNGCAAFGISGTTVRLPNLTNMFVQGSSDELIGTTLSAGLPNIEGSVNLQAPWTNASTSGALSTTSKHKAFVGGDIYQITVQRLDLNASLSNSIYGNSNTVQPPAVKYIWCIQVSGGYQKNASAQSIADLTNQLQNKADRIEIPNKLSQLTNDSQFATSGFVNSKFNSLIRNNVVDEDSTSITVDLAANTDYDYGTLSSLTISSFETSHQETNIYFSTAATFTISYATGMKAIGDVTTFNTNSEYVITINNGIVVVAEVKPIEEI